MKFRRARGYVGVVPNSLQDIGWASDGGSGDPSPEAWARAQRICWSMVYEPLLGFRGDLILLIYQCICTFKFEGIPVYLHFQVQSSNPTAFFNHGKRICFEILQEWTSSHFNCN